MPVPESESKPSERKPVDRWLALGSAAVGIAFWLLPKTPLVIILALLLIFALLVHPIWNFWWIEEKLRRRLTACFLFAACLVGLGYISWPPHSQSGSPTTLEKTTALSPTLPSPTSTDNSKKPKGTKHIFSSTTAKKNAESKIEISGDNNVTSINQSGGITAGTYINQADLPRRLTPEQIAKLQISTRNACPKLQNFTVTAANGNQEAQVYALDFVKIFKASGCISDLELPIPGLTADVVGVRIGVRDLQNIPPGAIELANILLEGGIKYKINPLTPTFFPEKSFVLVVGAKQ